MPLQLFPLKAVSYTIDGENAQVEYEDIAAAQKGWTNLSAFVHRRLPGSPDRIAESHFWMRFYGQCVVEFGYRKHSELGKSVFEMAIEMLEAADVRKDARTRFNKPRASLKASP